jgi:peptidoglycan hydrolase-like protein with peptidoglycan-binding domain
MHHSRMFGMVVFVAVAVAVLPTYTMADTKIALKNEPTYEVSRLSTTGSRAQLKTMQQTLKDKGFDPGPIDGTMGPRTATALRDYQKAESPTLTEKGGPVAALLMLGILFRDRHPTP